MYMCACVFVRACKGGVETITSWVHELAQLLTYTTKLTHQLNKSG